MMIMIFITSSSNGDFQVSKLASDNDLFRIKGIIAYNNNKKSIYISKVDYAENEEEKEYLNVECVLYEVNGNIEKRISTCNSPNSKDENQTFTLSELLENIEQATNLIEAEKEALETQKSKLVALQEENDKKIAMVSNMKVLKTNYMNQLTEEEKALQADIEIFNQEMAQIESDLINLTDSNSAYAGGEMAWPAPGYYTITSPFGYRVHPILGVTRFHSGVDIGVPTGGKIVAANDATVIKTTSTSSYGNMVMIDHGGGIVTLYAHGSKIIATLGQEVKRGDVIMEAGSTGWSTGPHLHFEVRLDGEYQQPLDYITSN